MVKSLILMMKEKWMSKLALLGGEAVRKTSFHSSVVIDEEETQLINQVISNKEFSRFMGSPSPNIDKELVMTSVEARTLDSQYFTFLGGKMVRHFEADFAEKFNIPYAITVNSATSGLSTALGAADIGPGDEVITTCMSFNATALSIFLFNSIPVFVDVDPKNYCLDPKKIEEAITEKTKAILVVHLLGYPADMDSILKIAKKHNLIIIEDCAQAPGTKYKGQYVGTLGDFGVFSFQETKNMQTGEGGMVITKNPEFAKKSRLIRNHGESIPDDSWKEDSLVNLVGMNFRMTELTAAMGIAQLKKLDMNNLVRKENTHYLINELKNINGLKCPTFEDEVIPHIVPFLYDSKLTGVKRETVLSALRKEGIQIGSGYLRLMYQNPIFLKKVAYGKKQCPWSCHIYDFERNYNNGDCPIAEKLISEDFIWFYHINRPNGIEDMKDVVEAFKKVFNNIDELKNIELKEKAQYKW